MSCPVQSTFHTVRPHPFTRGGNAAQALARVIRERSEEWMVKRTVQSLRALDDRTLMDIGLSRSEIEFDALRWGRGKATLRTDLVHVELPSGQPLS